MANKYNVSAEESQQKTYSHLNGSREEILDRYVVSELAKAWPVYRDASEWKNYRESFVDEGSYLWTTWGGGVDIDDFIEISKQGRENGDFIMHRECGTLVDLNPRTNRAVAKMKATITQRFFFLEGACDVECDCRFIYFCLKIPTTGEWKIKYYKVFYEKDKRLPLDGQPLPIWDEELLKKFPEGYKHLGAAQSRLGHDMQFDLPTLQGEGFRRMYSAIEAWLEGSDDETAKALGVPGF